MDRFEEIVSTAQIAVGIYGNPETAEYLFLDFPLPEEISPQLGERGVVFLGILGLVRGSVQAVFSEPLAEPVIQALAGDFVRRLEVEMSAVLDPTPSVSWLESLHCLEDPRPH